MAGVESWQSRKTVLDLGRSGRAGSMTFAGGSRRNGQRSRGSASTRFLSFGRLIGSTRVGRGTLHSRTHTVGAIGLTGITSDFAPAAQVAGVGQTGPFTVRRSVHWIRPMSSPATQTWVVVWGMMKRGKECIVVKRAMAPFALFRSHAKAHRRWSWYAGPRRTLRRDIGWRGRRYFGCR